MGVFDWAKNIGGQIVGTVVATTTGIVSALTGNKPTATDISNVATQISQTKAAQLGGAAVLGAGAVAGATFFGATSAGATTVSLAGQAAKATGKTIAQSFVKAPIPTTAAALIGAPLVVGAVSKEPKLITELPKKAFQTGQSIVSTVEEHPVASALLGGITGGVIIGETIKAVSDKAGKQYQTMETDTLNSPTSSVNPAVSTNQATPVVPATTQITTGTKGTTKRKKYKKKREVPMINIKIDNREDNDVYDRKVYKGGRR